MDQVQSGGPWTRGPCFVLTQAKHVQISSYERIACLNTVGIRFSGTITKENFGYLSVSHPYLHIINRETALSLIVSP